MTFRYLFFWLTLYFIDSFYLIAYFQFSQHKDMKLCKYAIFYTNTDQSLPII